MDLESVSGFLKQRMTDPLPGPDASDLMSARMKMNDRSMFNYKQPPKPGSVLILLYELDGEVRFPLIQRPNYPGVHSGQMALPGGKKESGESDVETALREAEEEIGVNVSSVEVIGQLTSFYVFASNFQIQPVVGKLTRPVEFVAEEKEVAEIVQARLEHLLDDSNVKERTIEPRKGIQLEAPYFDLEGKMVWGATAMMLNELKVVLKEKF